VSGLSTLISTLLRRIEYVLRGFRTTFSMLSTESYALKAAGAIFPGICTSIRLNSSLDPGCLYHDHHRHKNHDQSIAHW
jgi:hypothetical protein